MKKIAMLLLLAATVSFAYAQDENNSDYQIGTIFSKNRSNGGYGAFTIGYSQIDGKDALISGARAGYVIDHSLTIGLAGYGFVNELDYNHVSNGVHINTGLAGGYGGIFIEPVIASRQPAHLSFPVLFGVGGIATVDNSDWRDDYHYDFDSESDAYLVVEPAAELELNLTKFMRMAAYASYRVTSDIELNGISKNVLNGWNFGLTLKVGKF
jgi:hypothetical protein